MSNDKSKALGLSVYGFGSLPVTRQVGLLVGLAASVAIGMGVALWLKNPDMRGLYSGLSEGDMVQVTGALQKNGIPFEVTGGAVMVPTDMVHDARLKLAAQGLPNSSANGFELMDKEQSFGTSQFMETARYQRALEGELARTISSVRNVESARVHLALPKQSVFLREQKNPSASVLVNLYPGRNLDEGQAAAITHLVSASVPNLQPEHVTVIDQKGRLLTSPDDASNGGISSSQFDYRKKLEDYYTKRIESLLDPIVGVGGVRAQVTTELDYTSTEQTQESYNPDLLSLRSEQSAEEEVTGKNAAVGGVPGALTNQPPAGGTTDKAAAPTPGEGTSKSNKRVTRNYELDRTVSHVRAPGGKVQRLSVAVVVDDKQSTNEQGEVTREPYSEEDLGRFTSLIKEAVGFNVQRGDTVSVINTAFSIPPKAEALPAVPLTEQPWIWQAGRIAAGALVGLFILMGVVRPVMRTLAEKAAVLPPPPQPVDEQQLALQALALQGGNNPRLMQGGYENNLTQAKSMAAQDPRRVAQVVKQWVGEDGG